MKRINLYAGLLIGAMCLNMISGMAVATDLEKSEHTYTVEERKNGDQKKETYVYGTVQKVEKDKIEIKAASVVWDRKQTKKQKLKDIMKEKDSVMSDFQNDSMKWKLEKEEYTGKITQTTKFFENIHREEPAKKSADREAGLYWKREINWKQIKEGSFVCMKVASDGANEVKEVKVLKDVSLSDAAGNLRINAIGKSI